VDNEAHSLDTTRPLDAPMLFLRTNGDEVAMLIVLLQLLCLISNCVRNLSPAAVVIVVAILRWCWNPFNKEVP
jgi:hypothetical protein